jgi:hypothetical protein
MLVMTIPFHQHVQIKVVLVNELTADIFKDTVQKSDEAFSHFICFRMHKHSHYVIVE